jgi:hypothetical protein
MMVAVMIAVAATAQDMVAMAATAQDKVSRFWCGPLYHGLKIQIFFHSMCSKLLQKIYALYALKNRYVSLEGHKKIELY